MLGKTVRMGVVTMVGALAVTAALAVAPASAYRGDNRNTAGATTTVVGQLSEQEAADLAYMREEEKLAHDVYVALYEEWGQPTFSNIAKSEQTHTDAIKTLLDRYGVVDPTVGKAVGEFTDPRLQELYTTLVAQGSWPMPSRWAPPSRKSISLTCRGPSPQPMRQPSSWSIRICSMALRATCARLRRRWSG